MVTNSPNLTDLKSAIHTTLQKWHDVGFDIPEALLNLVITRQHLNTGDYTTSQLAVKTIIHNFLKEFESISTREFQVISRRYLDKRTVDQVADELNLGTESIKKIQRAGILNLSKAILKNEKLEHTKIIERLEQRLITPTYSQLFGTQIVCAQVSNLLISDGSPWIVSLSGLGGLGKTSIANQIARKIIRTLKFDELTWVAHKSMTSNDSANNVVTQFISNLYSLIFNQHDHQRDSQKVDRIVNHLKLVPHLIIVDNLEYLEDVSALLPIIQKLSNPSKFLITSRAWTPNLSNAPRFVIEELVFKDFVALFREQSKLHQIQNFSSITNDNLKEFYDLIGGNPLFTKLVVGLLTVYDAGYVLDDLKSVRTHETEKMYKFVYQKIWKTLSPNSQNILENMPLASLVDGMGLNQLASICKLDTSQTMGSIYELVAKSLLEVRGDIHERRYAIHALTNSFLQTDIIGHKFD